MEDLSIKPVKNPNEGDQKQRREISPVLPDVYK